MERAEAIYTLKNTAWLGTNEDREKTEQAVNMAIEALSAEPTNLIRREEAIDKAKYLVNRWIGVTGKAYEEKVPLIEEVFNAIPSAKLSAKPTAIRCRTLLSDEDFKMVAKQIRETNQNVIVIPCEAEVASTETLTETSTDLISRADAIEAVCDDCPISFKEKCEWRDNGHCSTKVALEELPSADRPSGEWKERDIIDDKEIEEWQEARCSVCGKWHTTPYMYYFEEYKYCPNCGAKMGGE